MKIRKKDGQITVFRATKTGTETKSEIVAQLDPSAPAITEELKAKFSPEELAQLETYIQQGGTKGGDAILKKAAKQMERVSRWVRKNELTGGAQEGAKELMGKLESVLRTLKRKGIVSAVADGESGSNKMRAKGGKAKKKASGARDPAKLAKRAAKKAAKAIKKAI